MNQLHPSSLKKKITKKHFIFCILFFLITSSLFLPSLLTPSPTFAEGNPFVPTTDVLQTGLSAHIGGDELSTASQNIASLTDITGGYYDSSLNRIVFIGTTSPNAQRFNQDDMAVAVKAIFYNNSIPSVNIADDPSNPDGANAVVSYSSGVQNTNFGNILFNSDYKLKQYSIGFDPNGVKITSVVPSYKSVVDRYIAASPNPVPGNKSKFTLSPQTVTLKNAPQSSAFAFTTFTMQTTATAIKTNNDPAWNQAATSFANDITANYDQYSSESASLAQAKQLSKIVAILKWISDNKVPSDFHFARDYTPQFVGIPTQVNKISSPTGYSAQGEINFNTPNTYIPDDGTATNLKNASQAVSNSKEDVTWTFSSGGQQFQAVAITAGAFKSLGAFNTAVTDMSIPIAGDLNLSWKRSYSSFSTGQLGFGLGWDALPARLYLNFYPQPIDITICGSDFFFTKMAVDSPNGHETFTYSCTSKYGADDPSFHSSLTQNSDKSFTLTLTSQTIYSFDANFQLTQLSDKNGNVINYSYDSSGKLTTIADTKNHQLTLSYNGQNLLSTLTDWSNRKVQYAYDAKGSLTGVTDPNGNTSQYSYDNNSRLTTVTDRTGQIVLTNTYSSDNRLATQKNASNILITYTFDNVNRTITQTDSSGKVTKTTYDTKARILSQTDPLGKTITYTYGDETPPLTSTDRMGNKQTFTYDGRGNLLTATFPDNSTITYTYDSNNRITKTLDGRYGTSPKQTYFVYDAIGNLSQKTEAGIVTKYTYDASGEVLTITDPLINTTTLTRDSLGNQLSVKDPLGNVISYTYDTLGRMTKLNDANTNAISNTYDANGNLLTKTNAIGTSTNTYDKENRIVKITLPNGSVTQYAYNPTSSLTSVIDALANTTTYGYDNYQNLISQQDALNQTTTSVYDQLNRQTQSTTPLGKVTKWQYDANGNITTRTDANSKTTSYQYDSLNRLTKITYPDSKTTTYKYDNRGNLISMTDLYGTSTYVFDNFDRITKSTNQYGQSIQYAYDNNGNLTQLTYPDGKLVKYTYEKDNRMKTVIDWNNLVTSYTFNKNGTLATRAYPNGITTYYTYDSANRLTIMEYKKGSTSNAKYAYTRDVLGNITNAVESGSFVQGSTITYTYDLVGKLTNFQSSRYGRVGSGTYTYDKVGNRLTQNTSNFNKTYTYDKDNKLMSQKDPTFGTFSESYDSNGNLITKRDVNLTVTLGYNFENQLIKYGADSYTYDGLGNRLTTTNPNRRYITDITAPLPRVLTDYDLTFNKFKNWFVYGLGLVAEYDSWSDVGSAQYYIEDGLGNARFLTLSGGQSVGDEYYDPFGNVTWGTGGKPLFQFDKQRLDNSNLYYLRARYYDPSTGRFLTRDSYAGSLRNPLSQNAYQYAVDNPINRDDPSGQCPICAIGLLGLAAETEGPALETEAIIAYNELAPTLSGTGMQAHHIIEQRFAQIVGSNPNKWLSIGLDPKTHMWFTRLWRLSIGYINGNNPVNTKTASIDQLWKVAQNIYADYPQLQQAAKIILGK